tara:strand:+ start:78 stop:527 length:450 start_codon:yes stop_codon:yes gene_type:complete
MLKSEVKNMILENEVTIAGETVRKERFGMASVHDENKTFTGNVLYKSQLPENHNSYDDSIETKFLDTAQVDGLTVWKSNGEVPFADMLLDFVQIGAITFEQAEFSLIQKNKDQEASIATLFRDENGNLFLGEDALNYRKERLAKIAEVA